MKALVIYDATGRIWLISYGEETLPQGLTCMFVDIPDGAQLTSIDVTNPEDPQPVFDYLPESDIGRLQKDVAALKETDATVTLAASFAAESFTDEQAIKVMSLYPEWESFIGSSLSTGMRVRYADRLYKVRQEIAAVLENQPPSIDTAALYEEISESHAGTLEDPIPYNNNMELFNGTYYSQDGIVYLCTRDTGQAVYNPLKDLVGTYVEVAEPTE